MRTHRAWLAASTGLLIVLGLWLTRTEGLYAQQDRTSTSLASPSFDGLAWRAADRLISLVATDTPTSTAVVYLPLIEHNFPLPEQIAFETLRDGDYEIYLGSMDGSAPRQLTHNEDYDGSCAVSPDGRSVAFYSTRSGNPDVYIMELRSGDTRRLTNYKGRDAEPAFSPDGQWVIFESDRSGDYDIYAVRLDGSGLRQVTDTPVREQVPAFSPDGLWVLYQGRPGENYDLYRVPWSRSR